jgi:hypothetical protein
MLRFYLRTSRLWVPSPSGTRKRNTGRSDSIRSMGFSKVYLEMKSGVSTSPRARCG